MENHYEEILNLSTQTAMFDIIRRSNSLGDSVKFDIICKNQLEKDFIISRFKKYNVTPSVKVVPNISEYDVNHYGSIYVKDIYDLLLFSQFEGKNAIIGNYKFNCEDGLALVPKKEITAKMLLLSNVIKMIDVYAIDTSNMVG